MHCITFVCFASLGIALFVPCFAIDNLELDSRIDRWPYLWLGQSNSGFIGSGQEYFDYLALWVGAVIVDGETETPRVSTAIDGWDNPGTSEIWPVHGEPTVERSDLWRDDWCGTNIYSPDAIADHEIEMTMADTLTEDIWLPDDPIDGPHVPLGLKITRTTYSFVWDPCASTYWIRYELENIGSHTLKDIYLGHYFEKFVGVRSEDPGENSHDDLAGFDEERGMVYLHDNDGRRRTDDNGNDFTVPHAIGLLFLRQPTEIEKISYNWWVSNSDNLLDWGPFWQEHCPSENPDDPLNWCAIFGTPMGDLHKYQLMSNGEHDYNQYHTANGTDPEPQGEHEWADCDPAGQHDAANGNERGLSSFGPLGNPVGEHTYLNPGETTEIWCALVGGLNFHNPDHPQPSNHTVDPSLYDFTDLFAKADGARQSVCTDWMSADHREPAQIPEQFAFDAVWPNPFNAAAHIRFRMPAGDHVTARIFDINGREIARLLDANLSAGTHNIAWDAANFASGIYFVQIDGKSIGHHVQKAILLK